MPEEQGEHKKYSCSEAESEEKLRGSRPLANGEEENTALALAETYFIGGNFKSLHPTKIVRQHRHLQAVSLKHFTTPISEVPLIKCCYYP